KIFRLDAFPCGGGLARESGVPGKHVLTEPVLSRASPPPHFDFLLSGGIFRKQKKRPEPVGA
ncbi:hypothetical protein, partial [Pseudomonas simiae]|uniref:hypothetical protein n=1 Tax=Pseudomonas simiae TaxID=321846 RepID=UPI003315786F